MSAKGLEVIDRTVQDTHEWVNELTERLDWRHHKDALRLLRAVLHGVRDHLHVNELAQFSAQMPILLRGMLFEGWQPKKTPVRERHAVQFIERVEALVGHDLEYRGPQDISTVFVLLNHRLSRGEIEDVRASLPAELKEMWPAP